VPTSVTTVPAAIPAALAATLATAAVTPGGLLGGLCRTPVPVSWGGVARKVPHLLAGVLLKALGVLESEVDVAKRTLGTPDLLNGRLLLLKLRRLRLLRLARLKLWRPSASIAAAVVPVAAIVVESRADFTAWAPCLRLVLAEAGKRDDLKNDGDQAERCCNDAYLYCCIHSVSDSMLLKIASRLERCMWRIRGIVTS
jgi:hypothetical protein